MSKRFTLTEAESLLPELEIVMREAVSLKAQRQEAEQALHTFAERVAMQGGVMVDRETVLQNRARLNRSGERLKEALEKLQEFGCVVKDLDIGLVDFPTLFHGREVYLCWRLGEAGIRFWHGVDEGFAGRKPIDGEFLENHRGDPSN